MLGRRRGHPGDGILTLRIDLRPTRPSRSTRRPTSLGADRSAVSRRSSSGCPPCGAPRAARPQRTADSDHLADEEHVAPEVEAVAHPAVEPRRGRARIGAPVTASMHRLAGHRARPAHRRSRRRSSATGFTNRRTTARSSRSSRLDREASAGCHQPAGDGRGIDGHRHQLGVRRHLHAPGWPSSGCARCHPGPAADQVKPGRHRPQHPPATAGRRIVDRRSGGRSSEDPPPLCGWVVVVVGTDVARSATPTRARACVEVASPPWLARGRLGQQLWSGGARGVAVVRRRRTRAGSRAASG